mmetsp:Transcript_1166/g.1537  ORF Transcript_1166/g.1537 Transcript_1166/m.1537 type:complete len:113 (+) Transcript_1166:2-340(+)
MPQKNDPGHYTNRSPFPLLHFLREDDIESVLSSYESSHSNNKTLQLRFSGEMNRSNRHEIENHATDAIWLRNLDTCRHLGSAALQHRLDSCYASSDDEWNMMSDFNQDSKRS